MIIKAKCGPIESGQEDEFSYYYFGIPYAKAKRFEDPKEVEPWSDTFIANKEKEEFNQFGSSGFYLKEFYKNDNPIKKDDSFILNIITPKTPGVYPVAIWFHGGGFLNGCGREITMITNEYAKRGVILVTVNYRLGLAGYIVHKDLRRENGSSGNYGLLDQIAAINWVYKHIEAFGGDKNNITIFGQSAGAMSIMSLMSSPLTKGKIKNAIIQSGGGVSKTLDQNTVEELTFKYLKKKRKTIDDLRVMDGQELANFSRGFIGYGYIKIFALPMVPVKDNYVLDDKYDEAIKNDKAHPINFMIGSTKNDIGVNKKGAKNPEFSKLYVKAKEIAKDLESHGKNAYVYYFKHDLKGDKKGAFHSSELWYMFGTLNKCWRPMDESDYKLSNRMLDDWASFMKTGKPSYDSFKEGHIEVYE